MDRAAVTLLSGPAGGPFAGIMYTPIQGYNDCITVEMGGTSFDAALIKDRIPLVTTMGEINRPRIALPMLNVVAIGAGGGCTDADLVLGYLDKDYFAGGKIPLYLGKAERAIEDKIAKKLGIDLYEAALGIYNCYQSQYGCG